MQLKTKSHKCNQDTYSHMHLKFLQVHTVGKPVSLAAVPFIWKPRDVAGRELKMTRVAENVLSRFAPRHINWRSTCYAKRLPASQRTSGPDC